MGSKNTFQGAIQPLSRTALGNAAEEQVLGMMRLRGWHLMQRHYRTPGRRGAEIDFIMRDPAGTVVFVEVRKRQHQHWGGALASVTRSKQQRIIWAARHFLSRWQGEPPFCRFDVVAIEPHGIHWVPGAFTL
jgi:putative endonuclease